MELSRDKLNFLLFVIYSMQNDTIFTNNIYYFNDTSGNFTLYITITYQFHTSYKVLRRELEYPLLYLILIL